MRTKHLENISLIIVLNLLMVFSISAQNITDENGKKQGKWVKYKNSSKIYEGQFLDDNPIGEFKYFYSNGHLKIRTVFTENGRLNRTKIFFDSHQVQIQAEGKYYDKVKDSTWNYYNNRGLLISIENYKDGQKNGAHQMFNNIGQLIIEEYYDADTLAGNSIEYFDNGVISRMINYEQGRHNRLCKLFNLNGSLALEGKYNKDVRDSIWTIYTENGAVEYLDHYDKGFLKKRTDKQGNILELKPEDKMLPSNTNPKVFDPSLIRR